MAGTSCPRILDFGCLVACGLRAEADPMARLRAGGMRPWPVLVRAGTGDPGDGRSAARRSVTSLVRRTFLGRSGRRLAWASPIDPAACRRCGFGIMASRDHSLFVSGALGLPGAGDAIAALACEGGLRWSDLPPLLCGPVVEGGPTVPGGCPVRREWRHLLSGKRRPLVHLAHNDLGRRPPRQGRASALLVDGRRGCRGA